MTADAMLDVIAESVAVLLLHLYVHYEFSTRRSYLGGAESWTGA